MMSWRARLHRFFWICAAGAALASGCATKTDWASRVNSWTRDQAIVELGPPDKSATLADGTRVEEWLTDRGMQSGIITTGPYLRQHPSAMTYTAAPAREYYLRLTFAPDGTLRDWKRIIK